MADLIYNGVVLDKVKTAFYRVDPVTDPSGIDLECVKVTIEVQGVFHELWHGSNKPAGTDRRFNYGTPGDVAAISLYNLREVLMRPRGALEFWMGGVLVLDAPQRDGNGTRYSCDVKGGPFPQDVSVVQIIGDRAAIVRFRIETYVSNCEHYCLSNRWALNTSFDQHGYGTTTIQGRASFRKDFLVNAGLQPDDFRKWLILPADFGMKRMSVDVRVNPEGTEVAYTVVDRVTNYGTGANSGIARVECQITSGMDTPLKSLKEETIEIYGAFKMAMGGDIGSVGGKVFNWVVPNCKLNVIVRIWGQAGMDRRQLLRMAASMALDRVSPGFGVAIVSVYASVDWGSENPPFVEVRCEFMGKQKQLRLLFADDIGASFNWNTTIAGKGEVLNWSNTTPATQLPRSENTRGSTIGRMVAQTLAGPSACERPANPPAPRDYDRTAVPKDTTGPNGA